MAFAETLRRRRLEQFLSQAELARRAGRHALTITRLEGGATAPSTGTVRALANALGVQPRELATPDEVAELRRVLRDAPRPEGSGDRRENGDDDGGAAQPGAGGRESSDSMPPPGAEE